MTDVKVFHELVKKGDLDGVRGAFAGNPELLNAVNDAGQTGFLLAKYYRQPEIANYLLSLNPKLDVFTKCAAGHTEAVLEEIDADPKLLESRSSDGWTPLHLAAFFGHPELAKALLNRGANVDARSTNAMKNTPLHAAAAGRNVNVIRLLLENGADVDAIQHGGWTGLHSAAQTGDREMAEVLLTGGADVAARADNNQCALDLALSHGHSEVVALLQRSGAQLQ
ncbi:MAG: ankyrin repeat domain-containing protein [Acidobacteriota bacterium]|nr:ankyrin repeat domain-containing protein [Acidobacteriota bacterium]